MTTLLLVLLFSRPYQPPEHLTGYVCRDQMRQWSALRRRLLDINTGLMTRQQTDRLCRDTQAITQIIDFWARLGHMCDENRRYSHEYWYQSDARWLRDQMGEEAWAAQDFPWYPTP
jgi:hypothetical protein